MVLQRTCISILSQLTGLLENIDDSNYSKGLPILTDNSIGKHIRHIIEFYETMLQGIAVNNIDYDSRKRNLLLETNVLYTIQKIEKIKVAINKITSDRVMKLTFSYAEGETTTIETMLYRELAYNIEHTIHHMAIIKIAINNALPQISLPESFGVAYSTLKYKQECAQ